MKRIRSAAVLVVLSLIAIVVLWYGTPLGRRASRDMSRVTSVARNAARAVNLRPVLVVTIRPSPGSPVFRVELFESGLLVVASRERIERRLPDGTTQALIETGRAALGDFNSDGCDTAADGVTADLYVMVDGRWAGSVCRNGAGWPRGAETRRLLDEIRRQLPAGTMLPVEF